MNKFYAVWFLALIFVQILNYSTADKSRSSENDVAEEGETEGNSEESPAAEDEYNLDKEQDPEIEYQKGSVCGYCSYCKFCKLCDKDCPCQKSPTRPNCDLCKYCKYCYLCKMACDTFCQPGGIVDRFTSSLFSKLPYYDKDEIENDIGKVKDWIDKNKDEL